MVCVSRFPVKYRVKKFCRPAFFDMNPGGNTAFGNQRFQPGGIHRGITAVPASGSAYEHRTVTGKRGCSAQTPDEGGISAGKGFKGKRGKFSAKKDDESIHGTLNIGIPSFILRNLPRRGNLVIMDRPLKISEITTLIKDLLEQAFGQVTLEGEISNFRPSGAGHCYFTLKDESSAISAVMFRGRARSLSFEPQDGQLVHATGSLSVYAARGTYQIIVESMEPAGSGDILRLLEERKNRLAAEGLFDESRKRPLPAFPSRIAVITSPTGAAVRDILQVLRRRNPLIGIVVLPAPVQGAEAPPVLVRQLETANRHNLADIIIIGRGGGSLEDLLPFSDEAVVRAVAASAIPVISAVGHETDWSLCDFAADVRAPTPSAAAELASPLRDEWVYRITSARDTLEEAVSSRLGTIRLMLSRFDRDSLELRMRRIEQPLLLRLDDAKEALLAHMRDRTRELRHHIALATEQIRGANPSEILKRGYSVVRDAETGAVVRNATDTMPGRRLVIQPETGTISARVEECINEEI